jgi:hypothetical protein
MIHVRDKRIKCNRVKRIGLSYHQNRGKLGSIIPEALNGSHKSEARVDPSFKERM